MLFKMGDKNKNVEDDNDRQWDSVLFSPKETKEIWQYFEKLAYPLPFLETAKLEMNT